MGYKWAKAIMKKITLVALALLCSVAFTDCAAKKRVKQAEPAPAPETPAQQIDPMQAKIDSLKKVKELRELERAMELEELQHDQAVAALNNQATLEAGAKRLLIPCMREALELENDNQMAAQGMATGWQRQELALKEANRVAIAELMTRFVGVIKNGIEDYSKDSDTKSLSREKEAQLEGLCVAAGEKAINELFKPGCREYLQDKKGQYGCYVALYVPNKQVLDKISDALEVAEIDVDKAVFRKRLEAELANQSAKEQQAKQADLERLNALQEQSQAQ